ncbi:MAG TPA: hypothetical protein VL463_06270 [Kofleriaceae bacterium]|jgi:hypothetical protein|nr:hypothetical protein [Kofleriaceae bacterium]
MRVRKATISGAVVDPNAMASPNPHAPSPTLQVESAFELSFTLGDLRPQFFRAYADWLADMREYPDPDDELEADLRRLRWPSLGVLVEVEPETLAIVLLAMGKELLADLEHGRDPLVPVRWTLVSVDEVELTGRRIVLRGTAIERANAKSDELN